jgi:hypothetical protein
LQAKGFSIESHVISLPKQIEYEGLLNVVVSQPGLRQAVFISLLVELKAKIKQSLVTESVRF